MTPHPSHNGTRPPRQPLFNRFPATVAVLSAAIIGVTAIQLGAPPRLEDWMLRAGALIGGPGFGDVPRPFGTVAPLVLHTFLHGGWLHLLMNMAAMAAFGAPVAAALGRGVRGAGLFLAFFLVCAIGGGLAQILVYSLGWGAGYAVGASSALSGLLPAVGWLQGGLRGAVSVGAPWLVINLVLAATEAAVGLPIAWAAHLGGLAAGFALFPVFYAMAPRRRGPWA